MNAQDTTFLLRVCNAAKTIKLLEAPTYYYVQRAGVATYDYSFRRTEREVDAFGEKVDYFKTRPHTYDSTAYLRTWMQNIISNVSYAKDDGTITQEEIEAVADRLRETVEPYGVSEVMGLSPEIDVFLNHHYAIPFSPKRTDRFFRAGLKAWSDFFTDRPELITEKMRQGYTKSLLRLISGILRKGNAKEKAAELGFCKEQLSRLSFKQRMQVLRRISRTGMRMIAEKTGLLRILRSGKSA